MRLPALIATTFLTTPAMAAPNVLTDIAPVHSMVAAVMGDIATPELLLPAGTDAHEYALRPSDAKRLSEASLIIWVGAGMTPWLAEPLETLAAEATNLELLETSGWTKRALHDDDDDEHDEDHDDHGDEHDEHDDDHDDHGDEHDDHDEDHDDHGDEHDEHDDDHDDHGDEHDDHEDHDDHDDHKDHDDHADSHDMHDHGDFDPHGWIDPANVIAWTGHIAEALSAADPENAATYQTNAVAYQGELATLRTELAATFAPVAGRAIIWPHDAYGYFEDAFGLTGVATISDTSGNTPGPAHIAELREISDVACVLSDIEVDARWSLLVAEGTTAKTAAIDPMGGAIAVGPDHYIDTMRAMANAITTCLTAD